jgi:hypothetical protein
MREHLLALGGAQLGDWRLDGVPLRRAAAAPVRLPTAPKVAKHVASDPPDKGAPPKRMVKPLAVYPLGRPNTLPNTLRPVRHWDNASDSTTATR